MHLRLQTTPCTTRQTNCELDPSVSSAAAPQPLRRRMLQAAVAAPVLAAGSGFLGRTADASSVRPWESVPVSAGQLPRGVTVRTLTDALEHPWAVAPLPDGAYLVTERPGRMRHVGTNGRVSAPISGLPAIDARRQGGLLDLVLDPLFEQNQQVWFTYAEPGEGGNSTAMATARLQPRDAGWTLADVTVVFRQAPKFNSAAHFGSRIVWANDDELWLGLGDRFTRMEDAQTLDNHHGKVVRVTRRGEPSPSNPKWSEEGALGEIWSIGHRNIQAAAKHPTTGALWISEHGPQGGDEVNISQSGLNYGWPLITYGERYGGGAIGEGTEREGLEQPLHVWTPSIAPSGMSFYTSTAIEAWHGSLFVGALRGQMLVRLTLDGDRIVSEERLQGGPLGQRIRDVRAHPDGSLVLVTDQARGALLRVGS